MPTFAVNNAFIFSPSPLGDTRSCHIRLFHLSQYPHLPEPPPNSQHAPVLRNPPRPTATPPRRGVFPIPSLEGCRVSGGVGCPQPVSQGTHPGLRPPLQGGEDPSPPRRGAAHIPSVSSPLRKRPGSVITRVLHVYDRYANSRDTRGE